MRTLILHQTTRVAIGLGMVVLWSGCLAGKVPDTSVADPGDRAAMAKCAGGMLASYTEAIFAEFDRIKTSGQTGIKARKEFAGYIFTLLEKFPEKDRIAVFDMYLECLARESVELPWDEESSAADPDEQEPSADPDTQESSDEGSD